MGPHAIIFDFDGTLADTNEAHIDAWRTAFHDLGIDVSRERLRPEIGKGGDQLVPSVVGDSIDHEHGDELRTGHDRAFHRLARTQSLEVFPGAVQLLEKLRRRWLTTAIATSSKKQMLDATTESLGVDLMRRADVVVTASEGVRSKPAPDLLVVTLRKLALAPEECLFIGDTVHDAEAARRARIPFVGVTCGRCATETELALAGAVSIWLDPEDVLVHLDQVFATAALAGIH